jgi:hypothetical protein
VRKTDAIIFFLILFSILLFYPCQEGRKAPGKSRQQQQVVMMPRKPPCLACSSINHFEIKTSAPQQTITETYPDHSNHKARPPWLGVLAWIHISKLRLANTIARALRTAADMQE